MSNNECHFVTEIPQISSNLSFYICLICLDLKDFSPQATKYQRFRILRNLSNITSVLNFCGFIESHVWFFWSTCVDFLMLMWGLSEAHVRIFWSTLGDYQNHICGLTELFLWIQLVAEGSSSTCRAFGIAMAKVRRVNVEGSSVQLNQRKGSVKTKENVCKIKGTLLWIPTCVWLSPC